MIFFVCRQHAFYPSSNGAPLVHTCTLQGFSMQAQGFWFWMEGVMNVYFWIDLVLNFFLAFEVSVSIMVWI